MTENKKDPNLALHRALSAIGLVLCILLGFFLICNLTIIIKGALYPERPPSVFGTTPMVVLSNSMAGDREDHIEAGDLIFVTKVEPEDLKVGDIIAYMNGTMVVSHRIVEIQTAEDGSIQWITQGDANNAPDPEPVPEDKLVGIYDSRIPGVGKFAIFLQTPLGMVLFIALPLLAFVIYDTVRRRMHQKREEKKNAELQAELDRLRSLAGDGPRQ